MELNRFTLGIGALILLVIAALYYFVPSITSSPTGLVTGILEPSNPFTGKLTAAIEKLFRDKPQAIIEQAGRIGILLPGGNSIQFTRDATQNDQDVVIILNAATTTLTRYRTYPEFVQNEFTYVPPEQLAAENPYVRAQYPNGLYLMPVNVD